MSSKPSELLPLSKDPSKEEEVEFLLALRAIVPENTYFNSLLSPDFMRYAESHIKNDFSLDLHADYMNQFKESGQLRSALAAEQKAKSEALELGARTTDAMSRRIEELQKQISEFKTAFDALLDVKLKKDEIIEDLQEQIQNLKLVIADQYLASR